MQCVSGEALRVREREEVTKGGTDDDADISSLAGKDKVCVCEGGLVWGDVWS